MKDSTSKEIIDAPGYWIQKDGKVWSEKTKQFLKHTQGGYKGKYRKYALYVNKKYKLKYVHRLLMEYFGPPKPNENSEVNHIDGNTSNNSLENLEWVSSSENTKHGIRNGLFSRVKLTEDQVREIKTIFKTESDYPGKVPEVAQRYGVDRSVIMAIKHNRNWKHVKC